MSERNDRKERRRPRPSGPSGEDEANQKKKDAPTVPTPDLDRRFGREPAVDREAIAAREAGIYDEDEGSEDRSPEPRRDRGRDRSERSSRSRGRRRRSSRSGGTPPSPPPEPEPEPEPEEEAATVDWLDEIEEEVRSVRARAEQGEREEASADGAGTAEAPEPEPERMETPRPEAEAPEPRAEPEPEEEEEEEEDDFATGIFEEPEEEEGEEEEESPPEEPPAAEKTVPEAVPAADRDTGDDEADPAPEEEPGPPVPDPDEGLPVTSPGVSRSWVRNTWAGAVARCPERKPGFRTSSGIEISPLYGPSIVSAKGFDEAVGYPGEFPFTRGVQATMYRGRIWTMRQYAGFASARVTNERFKYLLAQGQTGLSVAFDLPTQIGYDSTAPEAEGEVGKVGVPINSLADMEALLEGIPLDRISLSMTINSSALILLLMVVAVAKKQGVPLEALRGTVQNDMLKEFVARNTYRFPLDAHLQLTTDLFRYSSENLPKFNLISVSGYHMREAGCTAVQEVAFTIANGIAYVERALAAGLDVDDFGGRLSFFFAAHNHLFEEVAKFRAARRLWAKIMKERFGAKSPKAMMLRFHTQTAGSTLTAKQPETNIVRVTLQALAAALGGTQSLHTNSWDEALGLPTEKSALLALRTQQVIAHESGVTDTVDPLGGSPLIEELTDRIQAAAEDYLERIDEKGGAVEAVRSGWMRSEIEAAAYATEKEIESGGQVVVGVNDFVMDDEPEPELMSIDAAQVDAVIADLEALKLRRDERKAEASLAALEISTAWGDAELPELILACVESYCTIGEICGCLESVLTREEA